MDYPCDLSKWILVYRDDKCLFNAQHEGELSVIAEVEFFDTEAEMNTRYTELGLTGPEE